MDVRYQKMLKKDDLIGWGLMVTQSGAGVCITRTTKRGTYPLLIKSTNWGGEGVQFRVGSVVKHLTVARIVYVWQNGSIRNDQRVIFKDGDNRNYRRNNLKAVTIKEANLWNFIKNSI
jgi:hypothetical protein